MTDTQSGNTNEQSAAAESQQNFYSGDGLDLREYIRVIIKRKKLILTVFFISVILAAVYSLFLPKIYQANISIMIMPSKIQTALSPASISLITEKDSKGKYTGQRSAISIATHEVLLKSSIVLERVITKLKTKDNNQEDLSPEGLSGNLKVENLEETNILKLTATGTKPVLVRDIVSVWADEYARYSAEIIRGEVWGSGDFVVEQFNLAKDDLAKAEQAVDEFEVNERLSLLKIELGEKQAQLESHYAKIYKLGFELDEKKNALEETNDDYSAMVKDGIWLGAFKVRELGLEYFNKDFSDGNRKALRQRVLEAKLELEKSIEELNSFINSSQIKLLREDIKRREEEILKDKTFLATAIQLNGATKVNLESKGKLDTLKGLQGTLTEKLSETTMWEVLSLMEGYNFFETRQQFLTSKLVKQEKELTALEKTLFDYEDKFKTLVDNSKRSQTVYDFYRNQFVELEGKKNSIESEVTTLEQGLSYSKDIVEKLDNEVRVLKSNINKKYLKLVELKRQLDICNLAYLNLSSRAKEAQIAKAMELGEVKITSMAFEPQHPIAPNKRRNIAIAGVVSLLFGVFMAFSLEFWEKESLGLAGRRVVSYSN